VVVEIFFCPTCSGYHPRAASLASEIFEALGIEATVTPGGRSKFDVLVDGDIVFSKVAKGASPMRVRSLVS
jgi:hypothetical protein